MSVFEADDSNFDAEVIQVQGAVLVDFSAAWCGPCKKLEPIVEEIAGEYDGRLKVVKVDVDKARNTAMKFGVLSVPTLVMFRDGAVKDQVMGLLSKRALSDRVDKIV
jgi:thioredoxin 1